MGGFWMARSRGAARRIFAGALCVGILAFAAPSQAAWSSATLHHFTKKPDGQLPWGGLVIGKGGVLYGTATAGGDYGYIHNSTETTDGWGTIFKITPPAKGHTAWTTTIIHEFTGTYDGEYPYGSLVADRSGNLYGITTAGPKYDGSVFELSPPKPGSYDWTLKTLHFFTGGSDGGTPYGNLIIDSSGNLYGTTYEGGEGCNGSGCGLVFKLSPPLKSGGDWHETELYAFDGGSDGGNPEGGLARDSAGVLYGLASLGGDPDAYAGTVYSLTPPPAGSNTWHFTLLHTFSGKTDGGLPNASPILDANGVLYATTVLGGTYFEGTVFKLTPPAVKGHAWTETVLHNFGNGSDGDVPHGALVFDSAGALFGTAYSGGAHGLGMAFKLAPPTKSQPNWVEGDLKDFAGGADGDTPDAELVFDSKGALYGTSSGSALEDYGTVFQLTP